MCVVVQALSSESRVVECCVYVGGSRVVSDIVLKLEGEGAARCDGQL